MAARSRSQASSRTSARPARNLARFNRRRYGALGRGGKDRCEDRIGRGRLHEDIDFIRERPPASEPGPPYRYPSAAADRRSGRRSSPRRRKSFGRCAARLVSSGFVDTHCISTVVHPRPLSVGATAIANESTPRGLRAPRRRSLRRRLCACENARSSAASINGTTHIRPSRGRPGHPGCAARGIPAAQARICLGGGHRDLLFRRKGCLNTRHRGAADRGAPVKGGGVDSGLPLYGPPTPRSAIIKTSSLRLAREPASTTRQASRFRLEPDRMTLDPWCRLAEEFR